VGGRTCRSRDNGGWLPRAQPVHPSPARCAWPTPYARACTPCSLQKTTVCVCLYIYRSRPHSLCVYVSLSTYTAGVGGHVAATELQPLPLTVTPLALAPGGPNSLYVLPDTHFGNPVVRWTVRMHSPAIRCALPPLISLTLIRTKRHTHDERHTQHTTTQRHT
jgi:hypothetical protein